MTKGADDGELPINASVIFFRVMMMMVMMTIMTMMVMMMIKKKAFVSSSVDTRCYFPGATLVWVNLYVRSFEKIDDVKVLFQP